MKIGLLAVAGLISGCGVGGQASGHTTKILNFGEEESANFVSKGFTFYNKTGILFAAAVTAGDAYVKQ